MGFKEGLIYNTVSSANAKGSGPRAEWPRSAAESVRKYPIEIVGDLLVASVTSVEALLAVVPTRTAFVLA